jgi:hypothetical protein
VHQSKFLVRIPDASGAFDSNFMVSLLVIKQLGHLNQISLVVELGKEQQMLINQIFYWFLCWL